MATARVTPGQLYREGDAACARGDLGALAHLAARLIEDVSEPLHCELAPLVDACADPCRSTEAWTALKERLQEDLRS